MNIKFAKYHALGNDFIVVESSKSRVSSDSLPGLARSICDRHSGVGADGIVWLSASRKADRQFDIYNADGSWAEMSGNGLRIAGLHLHRLSPRRKKFQLETVVSVQTVTIGAKRVKSRLISCDLGKPEFATEKIPVKTRLKQVINQPLKFGPASIPVTCVATGNPHVVMVVDNFDFDWLTLGAEIATSKLFPNGANVEFVKIISKNKIELRLWERGVGETSSSGTGAAAAVAATTIMGITNRKCTVVSTAGQVQINWSAKDVCITLTGPVEHIADGEFTLQT